MMLTLNSTLTLNRLERVVRKHRDCSGCPPGTYPVQEASTHDTKFMEMQMTADFHFWIVYLVSSEKKFLHLRTHFCSYRGQLLLILLLARVPSCLLWNFDALKHIKSFYTSRHCSHRAIYNNTIYSLFFNQWWEKVIFTKCGRQNKTHPSHPQMVQSYSQETVNKLYYRHSSDTLQVAFPDQHNEEINTINKYIVIN